MIKLYCNIKVLLQAIGCRKVLYCKVRGVLQAGKAVSRYKNCIVTEMASFWLQYQKNCIVAGCWLAGRWLSARGVRAGRAGRARQAGMLGACGRGA